VYYVPTADGKKGYYASEIGGVSDIYIAQLYSEKEKSLSMVSGFVQDRKKIIIDTFLLSDCNIKGDTITSPNKKITLSNHTYFNKDSVLIRSRKINDNKITITDSTFKIPENASIYVIDADTKILENSYSPNSFTGKYIFVLNSAKNYKIYFEAKGYIFDTRDIKALKSKKYQNISYNSKLDTLIKGNVKKTKKIGFEPGLTTINSFSVLELEILSLFLKKNEDLYLNISGYDYLFDESNRNYFPLEYEYAQERKRKLINYLQDKGINPRRIYTDMFPANIIGDSLEYTVFNEKTLKEAVALKEERKEIFVNVLENANKTEEQIYAEYGLDSLSQEKIFIVNDIQFEINQYKINGQEENINSFAEYLKQNKDVIVQIGGFTDEQGLKSYNYDLARKRAETVKAELIKKGVNKNQLKTKIYADENPIALNRGEDGEFLWESLKYNRRVEFKVLNQTGKDNLIVKNINVPDQFKISKIKASENKTFAISLLISDTPQNLDDFSNLTDVKEKQYSDGTFMYFYGDFKDNDQVLNELSKVKTKFPDAFIFVKNF
jgi:outer membrane protein OmpA-like peptidoglycan-associated protein